MPLSADVAPQMSLFGPPPGAASRWRPARAAARRATTTADERPAFERRAMLRSERHRLVSEVTRRDRHRPSRGQRLAQSPGRRLERRQRHARAARAIGGAARRQAHPPALTRNVSSVTRFSPPDASRAPRYTGIRTFARLPHVAVPHEGVDAAVIGVPFDTATSFRAGARFGPEAIRVGLGAAASVSPGARRRRVRDAVARRRRRHRDHAGQRAAHDRADRRGAASRSSAPGSCRSCSGGDHSIVLGELRAQAAVHGPVALVLLDAHADTWDQYYGERYFHGTPFRRASRRGCLIPRARLLAGMRGPLYAAADVEVPREMGFEVITGERAASR